MRLFDMNLNLCPAPDISFEDEADNSPRGRCYGTSPGLVVALAGTFNHAASAAEGCVCSYGVRRGYSRCPPAPGGTAW